MPHADVSNSPELSEDRIELLSEVYLDALLERFSAHWIGLFENTTDGVELRAFRGEAPSREYFNLESEASTKTHLSDFFAGGSQVQVQQPVSFGGCIVGWIVTELNSKDRDQELQTELKQVADQISSLLAWDNASWSTRLHTLEHLWNLKRRYTGFDWIGIYRLDPRKSDQLILSTYIGEPTEHIQIPVATGICGAAVREGRTLNIPNVHEDPRFIACSIKTQSELVVPIRDGQGRIVAEIDIDSNTPQYFSGEKIAAVEALAIQLGRAFDAEKI